MSLSPFNLILTLQSSNLIMCPDQNKVTSPITTLNHQFNIHDLGPTYYFLNIEFLPHPNGLVLSQSHYIHSSFDSSVYWSVVGALPYTTITRPDIAFSVHKACQTMHTPSTQHWVNLKHLLRYLKGSILHSLLFRHSPSLSLAAFSNADWVGSPSDRQFTRVYLIFFGTNLVSWSSKKQPTVARSSTAAEYRAVADTIAELLWIRSLLAELRIPFTSPTTLWCDNVGATYLTANPIFHARTKHVEFDYHFVPEQVLSKHLRVCIISSTEQHADLLTKALPKARFKLLFNKLNLVSRQSLRGAIEEEDPSG
ncbi:unnamed protein product [Spirodela intermedia]|uniref:Uncharacterized protein n=1 Tax=Spirodela intermedia TaxID=51605 RepID=A0A7I8K987_SPIIN|nr:unnamed protein product [Spirodela intermedia]